MGLIYSAVNRETGKVYVGQTWESLRSRWVRHKYKAVRGSISERTSCRHFYAAIRKYGTDRFELQILSVSATQKALDNLEKVWILLLRASDRECGYNLKLGGSAGQHSAETRARMSRTHKACPNSGVFKFGASSWMKGKHHSAESKAKTSRGKGGTGVTLTAAQRQAKYRLRHGWVRKQQPWSVARRDAYERRFGKTF
jgi:group I intron endonuclease